MQVAAKNPVLRSVALKPQKTNGTVKTPVAERPEFPNNPAVSTVPAQRRSTRKSAARRGAGRWGWRLAMATLVTASLLAAWWPARAWIFNQSDLSVLPVEQKSYLATRFAAPGLVEASGGALRLAFEGSGMISEMSVAEGDTVKAGQVLAQLEHTEQNARVAGADAAVHAAQADLARLTVIADQQIEASRQIRQRLEQAWTQLKTGARAEDLAAQAAALKAAELEAERLESNSTRRQKSGLVTEQEQLDLRKTAERARQQATLECAKLDRLKNGSVQEELLQAEAAFMAADADYQRELQSRPFVLEQANHLIKQRQAELAVARRELEKTNLRAPQTGTVLWQFLHAGETVSALAPQPVVTLADLTRLEIRAEVDEADFPRITPDQAVEIRCEAYPERVFTGRVLRINRAAGQKRFLTGEVGERLDVRVIEAVVQLDKPEAFVVHQRVTVYFPGAQLSNESKAAPAHP